MASRRNISSGSPSIDAPHIDDPFELHLSPSTKEYFMAKFGFLTENKLNIIPEEKFKQLCYYMTARHRGLRRVSNHKLFHKRLNIHLEDLYAVLAFWQFHLYNEDQYLNDTVIRSIDDFLLDHDPIRKNPYISTKSIQIAEIEIIDAAFCTLHNLPSKIYSDLPIESVSAIHPYVIDPKKYIPEYWRMYDHLRKLPDYKIPTTIITWICRLELIKRIFPTIARDLDLMLTDRDRRVISRAMEQFFIANFNSQIGDIVSLSLLFIGLHKNTSIEFPEDQPKRSIQRTSVYVEKFGSQIQELLSIFGDGM